MKPTPLTLAALLVSASAPAISCQVQTNWKITFFGYPDNSPPSGDIAFNCGRGFAAGGDGSLNNPVTMAAAYNVFAKCEVIYIPYLKKYARYEDYCGQCGMLIPFLPPFLSLPLSIPLSLSLYLPLSPPPPLSLFLPLSHTLTLHFSSLILLVMRLIIIHH